MCQMLRIQVEKSTDLHDEMRQQLKDIHEQTESTNESHKKLQLRVGDIEHRLRDVEQRLSVTQELIYSRVGDVEQRQDQFDSRVGDVDQKLSATQELIYSRVGELKKAVDAVKFENRAHIPSKEGKLF